MTEVVSFVPNSYSMPNVFADKLMHLLEPTEWKVLCCVVRHILGWHDKIASRIGAISLRLLEIGFTTKDGVHYFGTGLSRPTIVRDLKNLVEYRILVKVGEPGKDGQKYCIPESDSNVDYPGLNERILKRFRNGQKRTKTASERSLQKRLTSKSDVPIEVNGIYQQEYVAHTSTSKSDVPNISISNPIQNHKDSLPVAIAPAIEKSDAALNAQLEQTRKEQEAQASKPALAEVDRQVPPLPDGWAWRCSSVHGTLAHAVPDDKIETGHPACGASLVHGTPCDAPIGKREYCLDCQRKAKPKKVTPLRKPSSDLTDAMWQAIPEKFRPPGKPHYAANTLAADELHDAGFTIERVKAYVVDAYEHDNWFRSGSNGTPVIMTMGLVKKNIKAWEATKGKVTSTASYLDGIPDYGDENPYKSQFKAGNVINSAWDGTIDDLEVKLGKPTFNSRVKGLRLVEVSGDKEKLFIVEACNEFQQQYILKHLMHSLLKTLEDRARCKVRVEVRIGAKAG